MTTASTAGGDRAAQLRASWLSAVERLVPVPDKYREAKLGLAEACRELSVDQALLEELVAAGLPADETPEGLRFDYHDVMNLGLRSGTGRSLAELGERQCMRMAAGDPEKWLEKRTWRIRLTASCTNEDCTSCTIEPRPAVPEPELLGGTLIEWQPSNDNDTEPGSMVAVLATVGARDTPRSDVVRQIHDDLYGSLLSGEYQYGWLPAGLRERPAEAAAAGAFDCVIAAWQMRTWAEQAGLEARTRRGFLLGLVGVEHAWTEVLEEDRWLPLDPVLAFLAQRHKASNPDFGDFSRGSVHNRLLAWGRSIEEPLADHNCPAGGRSRVDCRQLPSPTVV
ncbi:transglutaminase domain-containing protein [Streptomyces sp. NA04227]|uniref:transglutaminase domain-containing protein n=1 Tax=Streptomyces sp. NA04227 TaxID=2742136 RepID=UPI001591D34B|nr:transglutaminase domain-containing protein [Streptomyces sp. NA04227]QKW06901.1 transglutaminase domain-containing protein [Streptomyces sp. NA04227]